MRKLSTMLFYLSMLLLSCNQTPQKTQAQKVVLAWPIEVVFSDGTKWTLK